MREDDYDSMAFSGFDGAFGISVWIQNQRSDARSRIMLMPVMCVRPVGMSMGFFEVCVLMNMMVLKGAGMYMAMVNILMAM